MTTVRRVKSIIPMAECVGLYPLEQLSAGKSYDRTRNLRHAQYKINMMGYWTFRGNVLDAGVNANNGSWSGTPAYDNDRFGDQGAIVLTNSPSIVLGNPASLQRGDAAITHFAILTPTVDAADGYIYGKRDGTNGAISMYLQDGKLSSVKGTTQQNGYGNTVLLKDHRYFVAQVYTGSAFYYYVNGVLDGSDTTISGTFNDTVNAVIGDRVSGGSSTRISAIIEEVGVINAGLDAADIANLYNVLMRHKLDRPITANGIELFNTVNNTAGSRACLSYLEIADADALSPTAHAGFSYCFSSKAKRPSTSYVHLLGKSATAGHEYALRLTNLGVITGILWDSDGNPEYDAASQSGVLVDDEFAWWCVTMQNNEIKVYKNNVEVANQAVADWTVPDNTTTSLLIGTRGSAIANNQGCWMTAKDFLVFGKVLTADDRAAIMAGLYTTAESKEIRYMVENNSGADRIITGVELEYQIRSS
jgi:hypothetical protein